MRTVPFYTNKAIDSYAARKVNPISLRTFLFFGRKLDPTRLVKAGNFVRSELPIRLAHRIRDLQSLPLIVGQNASLEMVYSVYVDAFERIRKFPAINNMDDNDAFCNFMKGLLKEHLTVIPKLAVGLSESSTHFPPAQVDLFMTKMLRSRISRRILTEQHIALTDQYHTIEEHGECFENERFVGIVDSKLSPSQIIQRCSSLLDSVGMDGVTVKTDGALDERMAYIPDHLEYMIFEILKNSAYATLQKHQKSASKYPITATIVPSPTEILIRFSDLGGGVPPSESDLAVRHISGARPEILSFATRKNPSVLRSVQRLEGTVREQMKKAPHGPIVDPEKYHQLGIGLPLSRVYAEYFGGTLEVWTLPNHGTDVYLRIPKLANQVAADHHY